MSNQNNIRNEEKNVAAAVTLLKEKIGLPESLRGKYPAIEALALLAMDDSWKDSFSHTIVKEAFAAIKFRYYHIADEYLNGNGDAFVLQLIESVGTESRKAATAAAESEIAVFGFARKHNSGKFLDFFTKGYQAPLTELSKWAFAEKAKVLAKQVAELV